MSLDLIEVEVCPTIPAKRLTDIESWLLLRVFQTKIRDGDINFAVCWTYNDIYEELLFPDKELEKALFNSRQVCPELCAAVERQISEVGWIVLGAVDYETIFQGIVRRHPNLLDYICITEWKRDTKYRDFGKRFTLITATEIGSISTGGAKIVHGSTLWEPEPRYIMPIVTLDTASMKNFVAEDKLSEPPF